MQMLKQNLILFNVYNLYNLSGCQPEATKITLPIIPIPSGTMSLFHYEICIQIGLSILCVIVFLNQFIILSGFLQCL